MIKVVLAMLIPISRRREPFVALETELSKPVRAPEFILVALINMGPSLTKTLDPVETERDEVSATFP